MKKGKKKVLNIISTIVLCIVLGIVAYFGSLAYDKAKKGGDVKVIVTFDDTETYVIPSTKKMTKEEALLEWPYIMEVKNEGNAKGLYQIKISDTEKSLISRKDLDYVLLLDDKEVTSGNLDTLKNDILYTYEIEGNQTQKYKLYIWSNALVDEEALYEYKLNFIVIKTGGPGF